MTNLPSPNSTAFSAIRVAIVEDRPDIRDGLVQILNHANGFSCVGDYGTMEAALAALPRLAPPPQIVLIDIGLPGMSGLEGIHLLHERHQQWALVVLTVFDDDARIFQALCAGATGYLLKRTPPDRLLDSLREVMAGGSPMSPEVARRVVQLFRKFQTPAKAAHELTAHEVRILKLLVEGHNYKTAAVELSVSVNTISFHVRSIYSKLQVHSKAEAVAKALKNNLV